jgi:hypothetical protein
MGADGRSCFSHQAPDRDRLERKPSLTQGICRRHACPHRLAAVNDTRLQVLQLFKNLAPTGPDTVASAKPTIKTMNYSLGTILAVIAIILVLATYLTGAPLVPVAVILLALAIIFGGSAARPV